MTVTLIYEIDHPCACMREIFVFMYAFCWAEVYISLEVIVFVFYGKN